MSNLLQEWMIQADRGDDIDLDLMVCTEQALEEGVIILNAEEAKCVYSQLTEDDIMTLGIKTKIIMVVPSARNVKNSFAKNLVLNLRELFKND